MSRWQAAVSRWRAAAGRALAAWRSERGGIDSTLLAAGLLLTLVVTIGVIWPLWHLFGLRAELSRALHMANRAAVGAFDRTAWTQQQVLTLTGAEERAWDSLTVSLGLDDDGWLPAPRPLVSGPVQLELTLEPVPGEPPGSRLLASRAHLSLPVDAFGQSWTLQVKDVHYLQLHE